MSYKRKKKGLNEYITVMTGHRGFFFSINNFADLQFYLLKKERNCSPRKCNGEPKFIGTFVLCKSFHRFY